MTTGIGTLITENSGISTSSDTTPMRSLGSGSITGTGTNTLTDARANFPIYDQVSGAVGLVNHWVQPNITQPNYYRIIDNDSTTLTIEDHDGQFSVIATPGSTYQGLIVLGNVFAVDNAMAVSGDPLQLVRGKIVPTHGWCMEWPGE